MSLIEKIKTSEFWNEKHENFNAASLEALKFLADNNLTLDSTIGIETGIKAVTGFTSRYERLKKQRGVDLYELKESQHQYDPEFGQIYVIDEAKKAEKEKKMAEEKEKKEKEWEEIRERGRKEEKEEKEKALNSVLEEIKDLSFNDFIKQEKDWKYKLESTILPTIFNVQYRIQNKFGSSKINPQIAISGNAKAGYKIGNKIIDLNQKIVDFTL